VRAAATWARHNPAIAGVQIGKDRHTIVLHYRDGHELIVLPPQPVLARIPIASALPRSRTHDNTGTRALVLEPFAAQLGLGPSAGQAEADALRSTGFSVDVVQNGQVTIPVMQQIPQYAVTYIETHAGVLPNGDAVVISGETDPSPYADYYRDHTLAQATVSGDPTKALYNGVTGAFFVAHAQPFAPGSLFFVNGCSALNAPGFWSTLQSRGLRALISWDGEAESTTDQSAASFVLDRLSQNSTVASVVADAVGTGVGVSIIGDQVAHLGYKGNGQDTLEDALHVTDPPTPTPIPTATATPRPTATPVHTVKRACKPGHHRSHGRCVKTKHKKKSHRSR
jgi:hypothetical protein